jgi:hypothetical protein
MALREKGKEKSQMLHQMQIPLDKIDEASSRNLL